MITHYSSFDKVSAYVNIVFTCSLEIYIGSLDHLSALTMLRVCMHFTDICGRLFLTSYLEILEQDGRLTRWETKVRPSQVS